MNKLIFIFLAVLVFLFIEKNSPISFERGKGCETLDVSGKEKCWETSLNQVLKTNGIEESLKYLERIYNLEENVGVEQGCHSLAHLIGRQAYKQFKAGGNFELTPNTSYCAYGFHHGFMESLLSDSKDLKMARNFCEMVDKNLSAQAVNVRTMCFHGIGHGLFGDTPDPKFWGNERATIDEFVPKCLGISAEEEDRQNCTDGLFNSLALLMSQKKYGLSYSFPDVFKLCDDLKLSFEITKNCYLEFASQLSVALNTKDILIISKYIENIKNTELAYLAIKYATTGSIGPNVGEKAASALINNCRKISQNIIKGCLDGLIYGFMSRKGPGGFFDKGLKFCNNSLLASSERENCYKGLLGKLKSFYTRDEIKIICEKFDQKYRMYCKDSQGNKI